MIIEGEIKEIIFSNVENGYTVFEIKTEDSRLYTVVGYFPKLAPMQNIRVEGEFNVKTAYGIQFSAEKFWLLNPTKLSSIVKFLCSGLIKNLGPITAQAIVDRFGAASLDMFQYPTELAKVKGVSLKKAIEFGAEYRDVVEMQDAIMFMQEIGISINMSLKIYKIYGTETKKRIQGNPYLLITDVNGIGFTSADKIAENLGIAKDSDYRICAIISHVLKEAANGGNNYLPKDQLIEEAIQFAGLDSYDKTRDLVLYNLDNMLMIDSVVSYELEDYTAISLAVNYYTERSIARNLLNLYMRTDELRFDANAEISQFEQAHGITLHENQAKAVKDAINNGISIITGGPGTGKTTIIKCIVDVFKNHKKRIALCAPTGRAAKRLSQSTGKEAKTIHRLLNLVANDAGTGFEDVKEPLPYDVVIIDEVSMVDQFVFNMLLKSLRLGTRLIMVGDKDQLASVGVGNILHDVIASKKFSVSNLTHIYRQSEDSMIVPNAHMINNGEMPNLENKSSDFFFEEKQTGQEILATTIDLVTKRLPKYLHKDPIDIQVLCPMKKGYAGLNNLNLQLQKLINPPSAQKTEIKYSDQIFRVGDKVMQMVNNYQMDWTINTKGIDRSKGQGVFNGDIGFIESINRQLMQLVIRFEDDKLAVYKYDDLDELSLAYAITIHKSQGSEFDAAVISLDSNYMLQTRNLLYTGVTRAKQLVVLVGSKKTIARMIQNTETGSRYSLLINLLDDEARKLGIN